jgi:hypothetical protein
MQLKDLLKPEQVELLQNFVPTNKAHSHNSSKTLTLKKPARSHYNPHQRDTK